MHHDVKISGVRIQTYDLWIRKRVCHPLHHSAPHSCQSRDHAKSASRLSWITVVIQSPTLILAYSFRSSACSLHIQLVGRTSDMSSMNRWNNSGPRQLPWITLLMILSSLDSESPTLVTWLLLARKSVGLIHNSKLPQSHAKSLELLTQLSLVESYCLPLLTFATGALAFTSKSSMYFGTLPTELSLDLINGNVLNLSFMV